MVTRKKEAQAMLKPDSVVTFEFPELPRTLQSIIDEEVYMPCASVYLPKDYSTSQSFPLVCFLGGAGGGRGTNLGAIRKVTQETGFICLNMPHFKRRVAKLKPNERNKWMRMYIHHQDTRIIWDSYRVMLERIVAEIPNLDREHAFLGGFSNGAHAAALLLNGRFQQVTQYFNRFFLIEGGNRLVADEKLTGIPFLLLQGEKQKGLDLPRVSKELKAVGADAKFCWMKGVGHEFPERDHAILLNWLKAH